MVINNSMYKTDTPNSALTKPKTMPTCLPATVLRSMLGFHFPLINEEDYISHNASLIPFCFG